MLSTDTLTHLMPLLALLLLLLFQVRGPPAKAAFDASGAPTKALEGFCRKAGVAVESVTREADAKGVEYCYVEVKDAGKSAVEVSM
jgi:glycyl-tRNA synthetase beta subunit